MKLIHKTTRYYLAFTILTFGLGAILFYFLIKVVLLDSIDDGLKQENDQIISNLNYEMAIEELKPSENVIIHRILRLKEVNDTYKTIPVYDSSRNEYVDYRQLRSVFSHKGKYYELIIRHSLEEAETLLQGLFPMVIVLFLILLGGVFILNNFIFRTLWEPFYTLLNKLRNYDLDKSKIIEYKHSDIQEFNELSASVEKMTDKIYKDYLAQKEFNENSSHELQTPLAVIRNKLDLLIQSENLKEGDLALVSSIYDSLKKLNNLNKGLILLNKIENRQFDKKEKVSLKNVIEKLLVDFEEQIDKKNISVQTDFNSNSEIFANLILVEIMLSNLLNNAIKHNRTGGRIDVYASDKKIVMKNTGKELSTSADTMFGRFKKDSANPQSVGLGLAIVKKICDTFNFEIHYQNQGEMHIVTIFFN